jgi:hypothetical protein
MVYKIIQFDVLTYLPDYRLEGPGLIPGSARFFFSLQRPDRLWGPPSLLSNGYQGLLLRGAKRQGREADHSPPSSAEVKNGGAMPPLPPYVFMA